MFTINIISAPTPRKVVSYDPDKDDILIQVSDIIGLIEVQNPDNPSESTSVPMYMCCDSFGMYFPPQLDINFIEFIDMNTTLDLGKYKDHVDELKKFYAKLKTDTVEVEQKGNVSHIRRIIRKNKEEPKNDT